MRILLALATLLIACGKDAPIYQNDYAKITDYKINPDTETSRGVAIDRSGFAIDIELVDTVINKTEDCLAEHLEELAPFCAEQKERCQPILKNHEYPEFWRCYDITVGCNTYKRIKNGFARKDLGIKIAPDWHYACDQATMVFPCGIDPQACINKGLEPTPECPCSCRSTVQEYTVITTPQFQVLAGELIRLTTGFNNPWNVPPLSSCANIIP